MFGKKAKPLAELAIADCADILAGSHEFLRMWVTADGPVTCLIDTQPIGADPFIQGIALTDCVRHGAKAYAHATGMSETEAEERIWAGLDAERTAPTDLPTDLSQKGTLN
ncbi:MAG TPA: DUF5076 domain-containing protein [Croceibacterium sp.]|jgi:hypothetical protein